MNDTIMYILWLIFWTLAAYILDRLRDDNVRYCDTLQGWLIGWLDL